MKSFVFSLSACLAVTELSLNLTTDYTNLNEIIPCYISYIKIKKKREFSAIFKYLKYNKT